MDKPIDHLSLLPTELLAIIFDLAYKDSDPPFEVISRAFLPFQRSHLLRICRISSFNQLKRLRTSLEARPSLGALVKELEVDSDHGVYPFTDRQTKDLLSKMTNIERIRLGFGSARLLELIRSLRIARTELVNMKVIEICAPVDWTNPFDTKLYQNLASYPSLDSFSLTVPEIAYRELKTHKPLKTIRNLTLAYGLADSVARSAFIVEGFPNIRSLTLDTRENGLPDFSPLLDTLPRTLESLTLRTREWYEPIETHPHPCDLALSRLVNLRYLYLGEGTFGPNIADALRRLPHLETLGFGRGALLPFENVESLILGSNRIVSLKKVICDQFWAKMGTVMPEGELHPEHDKTKWHHAPDWVLPEWPFQDFMEWYDGFTGSRERESTVKVEGTSVEAFRIDRAHSDECVNGVTAFGFDTADWNPARELLGDEYVDGLLGDLMGDVLEWMGFEE